MQTMRLGEVLAGGRPELVNEWHRVYVIRDGATVFYVGRSTLDVCGRILDHCGEPSGNMGNTLPDRLGAFILANAPQSAGWQADLLTMADCAPYIGQAFPAFKNWDLDAAEAAAIRVLRPCLNYTLNDAGNPLPNQYRLPYDPGDLREAAGLLHVPYEAPKTLTD